jgi:hypothetical protein
VVTPLVGHAEVPGSAKDDQLAISRREDALGQKVVAKAHEAAGQGWVAAHGGEEVRTRTALDVGAQALIEVLHPKRPKTRLARRLHA